MTWALSDVKNVDIWDGKPSGMYEKYIKNAKKKMKIFVLKVNLGDERYNR